MIGSEVVDFEDGKIYVKGKPYPETPDLLQLFFKKHPNEELVKPSNTEHFEVLP